MKKYIIVTIAMVVSLSLSAQLKKFTVEVPVMPKVGIADSIQSITIMNRSLTPEFVNYLDDSLQISFYRSNFKADRVILDSLVSDTTIQALSDMLFDSYRFDVVVPVDRNISRFLDFKETPDTLTRNLVQATCALYETDALLVLENFAMRFVTNYSRKREFIYDAIYNVHSASIDVYYRAHWRLYSSFDETLLVDFVDVDTLYWDGQEFDASSLFTAMPSVKQAGIETGFFAAAKVAELIAPSWKPETRYYYLMKKSDIDQSVKFAAEGRWDLALNNWLLFVDNGSRNNRSRIMLNIALAYEMTGDINKAIEWVTQAQKLFYREVGNHYLKQLIVRQNIVTVNKRNISK